jgi:hypothetical protein
MKLRIVSVIAGGLLFAIIYDGLSGDWRTDSVLVTMGKILGTALI